MRVKIGDTWYDSEDYDAIMLQLSDKDKENIANMLPECDKIAFFKRDKFTEDEINEWMELTPERVAEVGALDSKITMRDPG